ncbi:MAG: DUF3048 domain-containing protein [Actinomycetota bacterium]|nr:DUF3048 domain-containing protein [Actinomycetota bacterium]
MNLRRNLTALTLSLGLLAATACGGGDDSDAERPSTTEEATTTTTAPPVAPLTGLAVTDQAALGRPALVVKYDNVEPKARPQAGINQADVVYEERVEGSVTRLLAIFHSGDVAPAGPVRSARSSDLGIMGPLHRPFFAWSGANATFAAAVRNANLVDVGVDRQAGYYERDRGRPAPSNLMLKSTADIRALPADGSSAPPALFTYRTEGQVPAHLEQARGANVSFGTSAGSAPVDWTWNGQGWDRTQKGTAHVDSAGARVAPENVVIMFVPYVSSGVNDQFGNPIPEAQLIGEGDVWVLTAGGVVKGRWHKPTLESVTTYLDVDGAPIPLTPGRTWVQLPQPGGATTFL